MDIALTLFLAVIYFLNSLHYSALIIIDMFEVFNLTPLVQG